MHHSFLFSVFYFFFVLPPVDRSLIVQANCWHGSCDQTVGRTVTESNDISNLDNDFENGVVHPWIEQSEASVKWKIENKTVNAAPTPLNGANYLRVDRGTSLSFSIAILRSPPFKIPPGIDNVIFSFSFWIRSKWPQFTNLELYLAKEKNESLLLSLHNYSDINNLAWQPQSVLLTETSSTLTLVFYAYCGLDMEDAVAIDDLRFISQSITSTPSSSSTESTPVTNFVTTETSKDTTVVTDISTTSTPLKTTSEQEVQTTTSPSTSDCSSSFESDSEMTCWTLEEKCYCFLRNTAGLSWVNADAFCKSGNMTLVSLETKEEDELIYNHVKTVSEANLEMSNARYWTSGKYSVDEGRFWEWASTEPFQPFTYTNWGPGEPNENGFGHCVYLDFKIDFSVGYWKDLLCTNQRRFICESIS